MWIAIAFIAGLLIGHFGTFLWIRGLPWRF